MAILQGTRVPSKCRRMKWIDENSPTYVFCSFINTNDWIFGNTEKTWSKFIFSRHFFLKKKRKYESVGAILRALFDLLWQERTLHHTFVMIDRVVYILLSHPIRTDLDASYAPTSIKSMSESSKISVFNLPERFVFPHLWFWCILSEEILEH